MVKVARILLVAATLSVGFAAIGLPGPWWVEDYSWGFHDPQRAVCTINQVLAWSTGRLANPNYLLKRTGGLYSHQWDQIYLSGIGYYYINDIFFIDAQHGWAVGERAYDPDKYKGIILLTTDGGNSWVDRTEYINWPPDYTLPTPFYAVRFANQSVGYIAGGNGFILRSVDGGWTWQPTGYMPSAQADWMSECYKGLWVDPGNSDQVWVCGDNSGIIAETDNGGANPWQEHRDPCFNFDYGPEVNPDGKLADFDLSATDFLHADVAMSHGTIGRTTNGGGDWTAQSLEPEETWFYGITHGLEDTVFAAGSRGIVHADPGGQEHFSPNYNLYAVDMAPTYPEGPSGYAVGSEGVSGDKGIRQRYDPVEIDDEQTSIGVTPLPGGGYTITLEWVTTVENNTDKYQVHWSRYNYLLGDFYTGSYPEEDAIGVPSSYEYEFSIVDQVDADYHFQISFRTDDDNLRWFYLGYEHLDFPWVEDRPNAPTGLTATDPVDHGGTIDLSWNQQPDNIGWAIGRRRSSAPYEPYEFMTTRPDEITNWSDNSVQNEVEYSYVVLAGNMYHWSEYSAAVEQKATDETPPDPIENVVVTHNDPHAVTIVEWDPAPEPNMGGYWVCCPCLPPGEPDPDPPGQVLNASPIDRTWYATQVAHGGVWGYKVGAMDRSGNFNDWYPEDWVTVTVRYISLVDDIEASAHNSTRRMVREKDGNVHAAFTAEGMVYYSWSPNEVQWCDRQLVGEGTCPALHLSDNTLHFCWVKKSTQGDAELWYRSYSIPQENWGPPVGPLFTASEEGYYGVTPPSLDVEGTEARVAWQSLKTDPLIIPPYPAPEEPIELNALGSFLFCGSFNTGQPAGFHYEEVASFWQGPCTVTMDTLMEHTPSLAYNSTGPYILWEHDGSGLRFYEKTAGRWLDEVISSPLAYRVKDPQIGIETGIIRCVWAERAEQGFFNIFHRDRPLEGEAAVKKWYPVQQVCATLANSESPVFSKNNVAWHELSGDVTEIYLSQYKELHWTLPQDISKSPWGDSKYPQIIYVESEPGALPTLDIEWSQKHPLCYTLQFRKKSVDVTPILGVDLGQEESSPITVWRDGYTQYGSEPYQTLDYAADSLLYYIGRLEGGEYQHKLNFLFYHEGNGRQVEIAVDSVSVDTVWLEPYEPIWQEELVPDASLIDSTIITQLTKRTPGTQAVVSGLELYRYTRGVLYGGPMSAGDTGVPKAFFLYQNCPNPLSSGTSIHYGIASASWVELNVYDISGRLVTTLVDGKHEPSHYTVTWDGRDSSGQQVGSGVYFYRLTAGDFTATRKLVILR